ncbi:MAG: hypothetical protein JSU06_06110 [Actinobacteria bacterium]|nr:hypothetical protein [Actinomycetota bacterium]
MAPVVALRPPELGSGGGSGAGAPGAGAGVASGLAVATGLSAASGPVLAPDLATSLSRARRLRRLAGRRGAYRDLSAGQGGLHLFRALQSEHAEEQGEGADHHRGGGEGDKGREQSIAHDGHAGAAI